MGFSPLPQTDCHVCLPVFVKCFVCWLIYVFIYIGNMGLSCVSNFSPSSPEYNGPSEKHVKTLVVNERCSSTDFIFSIAPTKSTSK